jgi:transcriptional regulator with XRE-family HTH domain
VVKYTRNDIFLKQVGLRIKDLRKKQSVSQSQLAFESGIRINQIGRIERGEINTSLTNIYLIAKTLHVKPFELLII